MPSDIPVFQEIFKFVTPVPADNEDEDETEKKRIDAAVERQESWKKAMAITSTKRVQQDAGKHIATVKNWLTRFVTPNRTPI